MNSLSLLLVAFSLATGTASAAPAATPSLYVFDKGAPGQPNIDLQYYRVCGELPKSVPPESVSAFEERQLKARPWDLACNINLKSRDIEAQVSDEAMWQASCRNKAAALFKDAQSEDNAPALAPINSMLSTVKAGLNAAQIREAGESIPPLYFVFHTPKGSVAAAQVALRIEVMCAENRLKCETRYLPKGALPVKGAINIWDESFMKAMPFYITSAKTK